MATSIQPGEIGCHIQTQSTRIRFGTRNNLNIKHSRGLVDEFSILNAIDYIEPKLKELDLETIIKEQELKEEKK
eukprot:UN28281